MIQEEKAKAYDEALKRAKEAAEKGMVSHNFVSDIFPELKESEDEKIRKEIIQFLQLPHPQFVGKRNYEEWIAWLEKQGEHANFINKIQIGDKITRNRDGVLVNLSQLNRVAKNEKQGEQKSFARYKVGDTIYYNSFGRLVSFVIANIVEDGTDNPMYEDKDGNSIFQNDIVEPKFKVGDWIICCDYEPVQIIGIKHIMYYWSNGDIRPIEMVDNNSNIHLWTIQDAKDGDVLSYRDGQWIFIYKGIVTEDTFKYYALLSEKGITVNDAAFSLLTSCIIPATKEQRDLLFQKMKEAGYEWDAEKKELKKIEQKPAMIQWKGNNLKEVVDFTGIYKDGFEKWFHNSWEEYEKYVHEHNNIFKIFNKDGSHIEVPVGAWIVKTPDGYNTASRYVFRQKSAWSEEDKDYFDAIITKLEVTQDDAALTNNQMEFLKSLKDRVIPQSKQEWSEEDEETLNIAIHIIESTKPNVYTKESEIKDGVIDWLKSLKYMVQTQPKQEWSEEDERIYKSIMYSFAHNYPLSIQQQEFVKSLKERVQPKQEWSEKDEKIRQSLIKYFNKQLVDTNYEGSYANDIYNWLKSLRPQKQQEWNKQDIEMIDWLIRCCEKEHEELCNDRYGHQDIVSDLKRDCRKKWDWLESLKNKVVSQNRWKPSDGQMASIKQVVSNMKNSACYNSELVHLLQDLEKLREE